MEFRGIKPIEDVAPLAALATQIDMHVERCGTQYVVTGMAGGDQRVLLSMLGGIMATWHDYRYPEAELITRAQYDKAPAWVKACAFIPKEGGGQDAE